MGVAEAVHGNAGNGVEVALAVLGMKPDAFTAHEGDGLAGVGLHEVFGHGINLLAATEKQTAAAGRRET
jgi:hypothetical protein